MASSTIQHSTSTPPRTSLLGIPAELRLEIIDYVLDFDIPRVPGVTEHDKHPWRSTPIVNLARTCKLIFIEARGHVHLRTVKMDMPICHLKPVRGIIWYRRGIRLLLYMTLRACLWRREMECAANLQDVLLYVWRSDEQGKAGDEARARIMGKANSIWDLQESEGTAAAMDELIRDFRADLGFNQLTFAGHHLQLMN